MDTEAIAFLGVGVMGGPMARRLLDAGHTVRAFDLSPDAVQALVRAGATAADSPADAASGARFVFCSLPGPPAVEAAILGRDGVLETIPAQAIVVDMTTSEPEMSRKVAAALEAKGARFVDAPVSGGSHGASTGTLSILVGGDDEDVEAVMPLLRLLGDKIKHVGPTGAGHVAKLCNNMLVNIHAAALSEVLIAGVRAGVDLHALVDVIAASAGTSACLEIFRDVIVGDGPSPTEFSVSLCHKDQRLFVEAARAAGAGVPLSAIVQQQSISAAEPLEPSDDWTLLWAPSYKLAQGAA